MDVTWAPGASVAGLAGASFYLAARGWQLFRDRSEARGFLRPVSAPEGHASASWRRDGRKAAAWLGVPACAGLGWALAGPIGLVVGIGMAAALPLFRRSRRGRQRTEAMERDLAELCATASLALRSGLSVTQALDFAGGELAGETRGAFDRFLEERRLGVPFDAALEEFGAALATDDASLFVLVMSVHARSGGDLAAALEEVASTIRHRVAVRRELRAASTQGRVSGAILGTLPIAFFLVLAATSHHQLGPVYRSAPGIAMVAGGLAMDGLAYLWIRRLLRIEV